MPGQRERLPGDGKQQTEELLRRYASGDRDFSGLHLVGLRLDRAVLRGADFSDCDLSGSFEGADLEGANFAGSYIDQSMLSRAHLERARFQGASFFQCSLSQASLQEADFTRAKLSEVTLDDADLTNARFVHADLSGDVSLKGAVLTGASFDKANLIHVQFPSGTWPRMTVRGALHGQARDRPGEGLQLPSGYTPQTAGMLLVGPRAALIGLDLRGFRFNRLDLSGADFTGSDLSGALFSNVVLKRARFRQVNLEGASFVDLPDGALEGADFSGARGAPVGVSIAALAEGTTSSNGMQILFPSRALAEIVGPKGLSRSDAVKKVFDYVKAHHLLAGKVITADEKLRRVTGKEQVEFHELTRLVNQHLKTTQTGG